MKRRKRKRKAQQDARPAEQLAIQSEAQQLVTPVEVQDPTEQPGSAVEIPTETENSASPVEVLEVTGQAENPVEIPAEIVNSVSPAEIQSKTEQPASPVETQVVTENSATSVEVRVETEPPASTIEIELQVEFENATAPVEIHDQTEPPTSPVVASAEPKKPVPVSAPPTAADRRTHPRYAFTAAVEVVVAEAGARFKTRVRDLSQQGCYVDTDSPLVLGTATDVRITKGEKSFEARARVVYIQPGRGMGLMFTSVESGQLGTLDTWISESRETSWLAANRRRSQRVMIKLPVRVSGQAGSASPFEEETHTVAISAHGALLAIAAPVYRGQRFTLSNIQTKAALECVVAHIEKVTGDQVQVGVEFMLPNPTFWRVAFPPKDWSPRHPDAKSGPH